MIFFISFAIVFTVFFKQLYYFDIDYLNIDIISGIPAKIIKENYDILINYQSIFYQGSLNLPDLSLIGILKQLSKCLVKISLGIPSCS